MGHEEIRVPPQNIEAEKSVLGAMMIDQDALGSALEKLDESWFYEDAHRKIYRSIIELFSAHKTVDLITLSDKLKSEGLLEQIGGVSYLSKIIDFVPTSANVEHYASIVKEKGVLRKLISNSTRIISECYEAQGNIEDVVDNAERLIFEVSDLRQNQQAVHIKDLVKKNIEELDRLSQRKQHITGIPTGFEKIDHMTSGLQNSDLLIIAGRPSMGKSALAVSMMQYAAVEHKYAVAFFSLEMSSSQLGQRMLGSQARVDGYKLRNGHLKSEDWPSLTKAASELSKAKVFIDDTPAISVLELRAKARRLKANFNIQLLIVDYLQLMRSSIRTSNRQEEISEISRSMKALAKELNIPIIALSQLSRAVENRQDRKPQLSDLRESGAIEQDADLVMLLVREEMYEPTEENKGIAMVHLAKHRNGPTGEIKLSFIKEYMRFENLAASREENLAHVE